MANKKYQKPKKSNPVLEELKLKKSIEKYMTEARASGIEFGIIAYHVISVMVLADKLGLTDEQMDKYNKCVTESSDSIIKDYVSIPDMIKTLKEEYNFTDERLLKYYPGLAAYISTENPD